MGSSIESSHFAYIIQMGFVLSILYLVTYYLTPTTIFGPLAVFRIELILAVLVFMASLPTLTATFIGRTPQSLALFGLAFATFLSVLATGWPGGAVQVFLLFIPNALAYFLVCLHCNSKKRLQVLVLMLLFVCLFVIAQGTIELWHGTSVQVESSYQLVMSNSAGERFYRLRGLGEINDPNDFAQLIACLIPLMFIFWRPKMTFRNISFVILPVCILLYGAFETHSRGGMLALLAIAIVASRRRIGTLPALLLAAGLWIGATALHFTGGRDISASAGQDRLDLWSAGLQLFRSHPLFGVGFNRMPDYAGLTAHNSVVVCAAELGLIGLYFWSLFLFPTIRNALVIASPTKVSEVEASVPEKTRFPQAMTKIEGLDKAEINNLGRLLVLSLTGFLVAAWFLSRAFVATFFLLGGIVEVVVEMALQRGMIAPRLPMMRVLRYAVGFAIALLVLTYVALRLGNLTR